MLDSKLDRLGHLVLKSSVLLCNYCGDFQRILIAIRPDELYAVRHTQRKIAEGKRVIDRSNHETVSRPYKAGGG